MNRQERAAAIAKYGGIDNAIAAHAIPQFVDISVSEAIVLGLLKQGVKKFCAIFGHGTTDIAEVLRVYEEAGLVRTFNVRHETAGAHAITVLKMVTGETAAMITSIGPGAMHAFAGSLAAASNGAGVWHIYGDETTQDEGFNMQQIPGNEQGLFLKMMSHMGRAYSVYEPWSLVSALRAGAITTSAQFAQPFFMLAPMNVQPVILRNFNLAELPERVDIPLLECADTNIFLDAVEAVKAACKITIKIGQGARGCGREIIELANLIDAAIVSGPNASGIVPYSEKRYMTVGGSKGSISGNFAMNEADLVIIIGARAVCQWDCSGTAWKKAKTIINFNINPVHAFHYNKTIAITGDAKSNLRAFIESLTETCAGKKEGAWTKAIMKKRAEWTAFKNERYSCTGLVDAAWKRKVLTQPVAIKTVCDFADAAGAIKLFDAGDVQANGFQIVEDKVEGQTFTDTGASYMGLASSGVLIGAISDVYPVAFCGDGSFMMNPQILIDGVQHGAKGMIVVFDNRRMAAITGLQYAQYSKEYKTNDTVAVDYVAMANSVKGVKGIFGGYTVKELKKALAEAHAFKGLSLVHVPVYNGPDELGGMGVFGDWNVGNWCERVQVEHHKIGL
jgi:thiamine pyrophosphate-dependent acetolactate synthase large subunit-like protein